MRDTPTARVRFGAFELDVQAGELCPTTGVPEAEKNRVVLPKQPFRLLLMLIERDGAMVGREEIKKKFWPNDTIVEFDHSINVAIGKLRKALGDTAEEPRYIATVASRGYRLMVPVEWLDGSDDDASSDNVAVSDVNATVRMQPDPGGLTGRTVSHYRVLGVIGGGGMGVVYRAEDLKLGRAVAMKFLPEEMGTDPQALERFGREARAASSLDHPNIGAIHQFGEHEGRPFIVMQLLEGQTLRDRLAASSGALPLAELLDIAAQVASGLQAAHEKGIIHRDIKPANIFLTNRGICKVLDFGLAKLLDAADEDVLIARSDAPDRSASAGLHLTRTGIAIGTAGYMSPEQVMGERLDARTDLFSFGLVMYEMATGHRAFNGHTAAIVHDGILHQPQIPAHELNSRILPKLESIINRALEKDREQRYQSAAEMLVELERVMSKGSSLSAPIEETSRWSAKRWAMVATVILVVVTVMATLIYSRLAASRIPHVDVQNMKMTRVTDNGRVGVSAISPDGRYVAYSVHGAEQSLWVQQVAAESKVQVVPPSAGEIMGVTFSPDGNYLYFVRDNKGYVVPALGGPPRLIIEYTYGGIGVSPDGKKLAFVRGGDVPTSQLLVANLDGSGEHVIAEHARADMRFSSTEAPAWSPDGKLIAVAVMGKTTTLNIYEAEGGLSRIIPFEKGIYQALWLPDQSGLLVGLHFSRGNQIWLQPYPTGTAQRLTNDLDEYNYLSLSKDGASLAAVRVEKSLTTSVGLPSKLERSAPITSGRAEGIGLAWLPDGTLLSQNMSSEFSSLSSDGKYRTALFKEKVFPGSFSVCNGGHFIAIARHTPGAVSLWRADLSGRNLKQLTEGPFDTAPDCSPDGRTLAYASESNSSTRLMRVSIEGGAPAVLSDTPTGISGLQYSPDGRQIADLESSDQSDSELVLRVRDSQSGQPIKSFGVPTGLSAYFDYGGWNLRWTPDGRTLTYALRKGGAVNLWNQSLSGGPPRQITSFADEIVAFDWSPDGKQLAWTRHAQSRDVVLISNFH